jgi:hypothetical protein
MALVLGTNCGFCLAAPSTDPGGTETVIDSAARDMIATSPVGATR